MYSFRTIRTALLAARRPPEGFPYGEPLTPERIAGLRSAPHLRDLLAGLRTAAREARETPTPVLPFHLLRRYEDDGDRALFERPYFARRGRLLALALVPVVDGTDECLAALQDEMWAICDEYTWCLPAHRHVGEKAGVPPREAVDLFAAETAHALAEVLHLLGDRLDPRVVRRVRDEVEQRVLRPWCHTPVHFGWESTATNWASVCAGAAGMAALLLEQDPERLAGTVERSVRAMESFLESYGEDGACLEGIGYWTYGFGYYVYFAEMLHARTGGALDLLAGEKIRRIAEFPLGACLSGDRFVSYSDAPLRARLRTGLMTRLTRRLGVRPPFLEAVPPVDEDRCHRWPHVVRDLLWTDPSVLGVETPEGTHHFEDAGWVVDRRTVAGTPLAFSVKGGHNAEPHNHNDLGSFLLHVGGESVLTDLGAGLYTRDYFDPRTSYTFLHRSSSGHSVPLVDGREQQPGREHEARVLSYSAGDGTVRCVLDLTRAYGLETLTSLTREVSWGSDAAAGRLELTDDYRFSAAPSALEEVLVSLHEPEIRGDTVRWQGGHGLVTLRFDASRWHVSSEKTATTDHSGAPQTVHRLRLRCARPQARETCRLSFACTPV